MGKSLLSSMISPLPLFLPLVISGFCHHFVFLFVFMHGVQARVFGTGIPHCLLGCLLELGDLYTFPSADGTSRSKLVYPHTTLLVYQFISYSRNLAPVRPEAGMTLSVTGQSNPKCWVPLLGSDSFDGDTWPGSPCVEHNMVSETHASLIAPQISLGHVLLRLQQFHMLLHPLLHVFSP